MEDRSQQRTGRKFGQGFDFQVAEGGREGSSRGVFDWLKGKEAGQSMIFFFF